MKTISQRIALLTAALCLGAFASAQTGNVGINNDGATPDPDAILDISSNYLAPANQKGLLIPRMTRAQRLAIAGGTPVNGLTVYQNNNFGAETRGFYYYSTAAGQWVRLGNGSPWTLSGNGGTDPLTDFLGPVNAQDLRFRTNNIQRMVLDQQGRLGVGVGAPVEMLDINGAIKLTGTSATDDLGTIRWNAPGEFHEGNIDGTPAGWRKLQNDYNVVENADYLQVGAITCSTAPVELGNDNGLTNNANVTPYSNQVQFAKHQYLFRRAELDLAFNQLFGDPNASTGLCPGPITRIAFWAESLTGSFPRNWFYSVTLMHTTATNLGAGFVTSADPASDRCICVNNNAACFQTTPQLQPHAGAPPFAGWVEYDFSGDPFVWNGTDNIVVQIARASTTAPFGNSTTGYNTRKTDLSWAGSFGRYGASTGGCSAIGSCGNHPGGGIATGSCTSGASNNMRPVVRWWGERSDAPPAFMAQADYIQYDGGFLVQEDPGWAAQTAPPDPYYAFKGPGTISAENGVWDADTRLNDHVFDRYFDGRVRPEEAATFGDRRHLDIKDMVAHTAERRHLPTMKGRAAWEHERGFSMGDLTNQLWATTETQALYLTELEQRTRAMELLRGDGPLHSADLETIKLAVCSMENLTESQKERILSDLRERLVNNATRR